MTGYDLIKPRRSLTRKQKADLFVKHEGKCWRCGLPIDPVKERWHVGHVGTPHALGGEIVAPEHERCNMDDAREVKKITAKVDRIRANNLGVPKNSRPFPGSRRDKWKKRVDGTVVLR